jgi:CheY-like chemotaxis protein
LRARRRLKVLVADDDPDTVSTLRILLSDEGYNVRAAYDGRAALEAIHDFDPDVAILDILMPGMTGWDIAKAVRKRNGDRPLLVAISGEYVKDEHRLRAEKVGFKYYLTKPCDPNALLALLALKAT